MSLSVSILPKPLVSPQYQGASIANLPASVCQWLGVPPIRGVALDAAKYPHLDQTYDNVIFILIDALASERFQVWLDAGLLPSWQQILKRGSQHQLTSVVPSTTANALTTLWTGATAVEHGVVAYEVWLKQFGVVANMILHSPISMHGLSGSLEKAGFNPETWLPVPTMGTYLLDRGIETHVFQPHDIVNSGLSRTFMQAAEMHPFSTTSDLCVSLKQFMQIPSQKKRYIWGYWGAVDGFGHRFGPDEERSIVEMETLGYQLNYYFLETLKTPIPHQKTLFLISSDHGQITTAKNPFYDLAQHPQLEDMLQIRPTGEGRYIFLHIKPGQVENVKAYFESTWKDDFWVLPSTTLLEAGLYGTGEPMPDFHNRIGDLTAIALNDKYLWRGLTENPLIGKHGGMLPIEMQVPLIMLEL